MKLQESKIELSNNVTFKIYHNLHDFGIGINSALQNWLAKTNNYDSRSFCDYIMSKDINMIALTEKEFNLK